MAMTNAKTTIAALVAQFAIALDIRQNLDAILSIVSDAAPDTLVILPEGSLSGYAEDAAFLNEIDRQLLANALHNLREAVVRHGVHLVFGSCLYENDKWYNTGIYYGPQQKQFVYRKVNLAIGERTVFAAGSQLSPFKLDVNGCTVNLGIQLCREIRFPEQWQHLARAGADVFAYLTNAVGDADQAFIWRSHLVSRAAENQRFILCANNADIAQKCPTMIVTPTGHVPWEVCSPGYEVGHYTLDLSAVSNWYLSQSRRDLIVGE